MILFKKYTANIYLYSLKNDDTHIPNQQLCTRFVHSFFFWYIIIKRGVKMFDYIIVGGGPAGYTAAISMAKAGKKVALFEKDKLGGTCLNKGCIPTKSLLHSSEIYRQILLAEEYGFDITINSFDFSKITQKRDSAVEKIRKALELAVKNSGVEIIYKEAKIIDKNTVLAEDTEYKASEIIFAAGATPRSIKGLEFDGEFILSSDDVLKLEKLPKTVLIVGSGAIGIEWSRIFSNFGVEVHLVEFASHLIPMADIEVSKRIERIFKQKKIKAYLNDSVVGINNRTAKLNSGVEISPDFILVAAGRDPIKPDVNDIKLLGDSCGEIQLAHYAIQQARQVVEGVECDKSLIPAVIYGEPEIAWVGKREQDCEDSCQKILLPVTALGKSWCDDSTEGFIKLIVESGKITGAHVISKEASSLIHQILIAMQNGITVDDLKNVCFAHPTYSEGIAECLFRI